MQNTENLYFCIPYEARKSLCTLLGLNYLDDRIHRTLLSDLPMLSQDAESLENVHKLFAAIGKMQLEQYEDYKQHKKTQEAGHLYKNNEQFKTRAKGIKADQCFQIKEITYCTGLGFFYVLEALARKESFKISVPDTIIIGFMHMQTTKIWTDQQGVLRFSLVEWEDLHLEIEKIHAKNLSRLFPASVLKYETYNSEGIKIRSETVLYKNFEVQEIVWNIHNLNLGNSYMVFQEFIGPKASSVSKVRVSYSCKIEKVFRVNNQKIIKEKKEDLKKITKDQIVILGNENLACGNLDFFKYSAEICDFFLEIFYFIEEDSEKYLNFEDYFQKLKVKCVKKMEFLGNHEFHRTSTKLILKKDLRSKLLKKFTATLTEPYSIVYPVTNFSSLEQIPVLFKEILKSSKIFLPNTLKISEIVADFLEDSKGVTYLHKVQKICFQEKLASQVPTVQPFRHISLYSATEGASVAKGRRQQVCCGDYCNLLKKNDLKTSEKIELLIKAKPEFSNGLYQLLKIQNFLNLDSAQSLFNKGNRIGTPLTQNMQYKTVRRTILEDRNDPNSLKSAISSLPDEILQEISLNKIKSKDSIEIHVYHLNKKLSWEYEMVPVCAMCYKIYGLRESQAPKNVVKLPIERKKWEIKEVEFEMKKKKNVRRSFVDFKKVFQEIEGVNYSRFIKEKILNSRNVRVKSGLEEVKEFRQPSVSLQSFANTTKVSKSIINEVVGQFEVFQNNVRRCRNLDQLKEKKLT